MPLVLVHGGAVDSRFEHDIGLALAGISKKG
jgi:hypothetical protein